MSSSDHFLEAEFLEQVADTLQSLPGVEGVALGGSRAQGTHRPDSDWDLAIYYRGGFSPDTLRDIGWEGHVSEIGDWGGGVFNGGAWLTVDGHSVDVHYRDLTVVDREIKRAARGEFDIEPLMFHLAGIPTYILLAELAINRVLRGELPRSAYPQLLREHASAGWMSRANAHLDYAEKNHARLGNVVQCVGLAAVAVSEASHSILAGRGEWATNEKRLVSAAGLSAVDAQLGSTLDTTQALNRLISEVRLEIDLRARS